MSKTVDTLLGPFNFNQARKFCSLHEDAVLHNRDTFLWIGRPVDVDFAKYMVEFLRDNFPLGSEGPQ